MAGCWSWRALAGQLPQYPQSDPAPKLQFSITISFIWWAPGPTCSLGQTLSNESEFPPPIYAIKWAAFLKWPISPPWKPARLTSPVVGCFAPANMTQVGLEINMSRQVNHLLVRFKKKESADFDCTLYPREWVDSITFIAIALFV